MIEPESGAISDQPSAMREKLTTSELAIRFWAKRRKFVEHFTGDDLVLMVDAISFANECRQAAQLSEAGPQRGKFPIDRPCSACSGGDPEMLYHDHDLPFQGQAAQLSKAPSQKCEMCETGRHPKHGYVLPRKFVDIRGDKAWRHAHHTDQMFFTNCEIQTALRFGLSEAEIEKLARKISTLSARTVFRDYPFTDHYKMEEDVIAALLREALEGKK
jgi:hypothetical protein